VVAVAGQRVGGVEAREGGVVVETAVRAAEGELVAEGVEVARVAGVVDDGRVALPRGVSRFSTEAPASAP